MICKPNSRRNLDLALERTYGRGRGASVARTAMANVIVGQLLPSGVVKGGSALKLRYGYAETRFTTDLDAARGQQLDAFIDNIAHALDVGWEGFTGTVIELDSARPEDVPDDYIMKPFAIKLAYNSKSWVTVTLEVGHDEIGDTENPEYFIADDIITMFTRLGFSEPKPIPLIPLHHQVAQKIHALTEENSSRAHDLVDLQLVAAHNPIDYRLVRDSCKRLFVSRRKHEWPPAIVVGKGWDVIYDRVKEDLPVLSSIDDAVVWVNELIHSIEEAE